ncbi:hypothetical protein C0989_008500 [Termitomyces sp. Mn162]|nr:hypothetical protein C0989_008500 [Termitomyces sp. Mn162]
MSTPDLTLPLATILQKVTFKAHETVANSLGAISLVSGRLPKDQYNRYLMMLWHIYSTFEPALEQHATHPTLEPIYNPAVLARSPSLSADIAYLLDVPEASWKSHPIHLALLKDIPLVLKAYVNRVRELAEAQDPSPLLGHVYVRYLGDLSGGQTVRRAIVKAYGLDGQSGEGLSFYTFKELESTKKGMQGELKHIKEWFRDGMNKAGERGNDVKASVIGEANTAFDLNIELFDAINAELDEGMKMKTYQSCQVIAAIALGPRPIGVV